MLDWSEEAAANTGLSAQGTETMDTVTIAQIEERLQQLPPEKLAVVYDFVAYLAERRRASEAFQTMLATEHVLHRDWDRPEEDEAWAHL
jgi:hypothetical protein